MIKNLIAAAMASILITQPPQSANDGTYYQDVNITETYEYETNEVNSVDDLIVGNIYHFKFNNALLYYEEYEIKSTMYYKITGISQDYRAFNEINIRIDNLEENYTLRFYSATSTSLFTIARYDTVNEINKTTYLTDYMNSYTDFEFYFIYTSPITIPNINLIHASDYLGEKTITIEPVETEGLYNMAYHFLYSRIYTNTELQGMETTLFGTTINMNMWLSHTTAIVIICLLLIVLIKFVIWLFKIVSGGMLWQ